MSFAKKTQVFGLNIFLIIAVLFSAFPFFIMLINSLKTAAELASNPAGLPSMPTLSNYVRILSFNGGKIVRAFLNSVFISTVHTVLTIFISALAAYAFAKYEFKGRNLIFFALLATMMVPGELGIPALYILFSKIGWLDTYSVQIFPGIASVFAMFLARQYMLSLPNSLIDAAKIDGAGHWRIFITIIFPICSPVLGALSILIFLNIWDSYLWPIIMIKKVEYLPIMAVLPTLNQKDEVWSIPYEIVMAGCVIVTIPLILVFLRFQDSFMSSVTLGAVKE